ncbi:ubiquitin-conjugating enzyme E2 E2 isoform X2 [Pan troglodytes]|uniref:ubiquitin-conjugating enzyme E2 E2 isoform X2 n=1 Tax=Pan troglodytes TaxID=9598 RepID=UPI0023EFEA4F|nr:ubiquitin-conjugating enzyme E2 E2 isoform X2 [Pan troglodytes]
MRVPGKVLASPPLKPPRQPRFPPLLPVLVVPSPWDAPRSPPSEPGLRAGPSCHFTFPRRLPTPSPDRRGSPPGRAPAPAPSRPRAGGGGAGGGGRRAAPHGRRGARALAVSPGRARRHAHSRVRARTAGRRRLPEVVASLSRTQGQPQRQPRQQPQEPELERPGAAAAAALRDLKCPLRHKELMTVQALVEEVPMEINVKVFSKNQKENKFSPRKRREKYPAKPLLNCQLVLKEFRRNLQKSHWTLLPTVDGVSVTQARVQSGTMSDHCSLDLLGIDPPTSSS